MPHFIKQIAVAIYAGRILRKSAMFWNIIRKQSLMKKSLKWLKVQNHTKNKKESHRLTQEQGCLWLFLFYCRFSSSRCFSFFFSFLPVNAQNMLHSLFCSQIFLHIFSDLSILSIGFFSSLLTTDRTPRLSFFWTGLSYPVAGQMPALQLYESEFLLGVLQRIFCCIQIFDKLHIPDGFWNSC